MNINELEQLAKAATHGEWVCSGFIVSAKDSGYAPIADTELDNESMSENASYIAAANPSAILELIAAYREAVAALSDSALYCSDTTYCDEFCCREKQRNALDTAKRLEVE